MLQEEVTRGFNVKRPSPILKVLQKQAVHVVFNISLGHTNIHLQVTPTRCDQTCIQSLYICFTLE